MDGTTDQRHAFKSEHERIGYKEGELWPTVGMSPTDLLQLLRTVPDGGGLQGYIEALRKKALTKESRSR